MLGSPGVRVPGGAASGGGEAAEPAFTTWGRVSMSGFKAEVDDVTMDGDVTTGLIGFDAEWERVLAGVMVSQSTGEGDYRLSAEQGGDAGSVKSSLTGVYPYARLALSGRMSAWALAGAGSGELTLTKEGGKPMPTDITMRMGAVGVEGHVLDGAGASGVALNVKSDAMWVGTKSERTHDMAATEGDVTRLRLIVEGERSFEVASGATFTPSAQLGVRHDGGDAETGTGVEVGAGLRYTVGAVTIEDQARALVAHEASDYEEWGMSGAVRVTPRRLGAGPDAVHRACVGPDGERRRAALVRARRMRTGERLRIRAGEPARDGRGLRLRPPRQPRRAHALRGHDARGCQGPHGAHRDPLAARHGRRARARDDPADK